MAGNVFDYLKWRGDLTFAQSPFNVVDSLILATICYTKQQSRYEEPTDYSVALQEALEHYVSITHPTNFFGNVMLLSQEILNTRRFKNLKVFHSVDSFSKEEEKQFSAVTYLLEDGTAFAAFRGTDESIIGWKEDFNMAFTDNIPSHAEATDYINFIAEHLDCPLRLGGHSKGGHLAVWAAATLKEAYRSRLLHIYNHDGPGFSTEFLESEGFAAIRDRVLSFVPESSIVGVLMNYLEYIPIKSDALPILQHDSFTWLIEGKHFLYDIDRTGIGKLMEKYSTALYATSSNPETKKHMDDLFNLLQKGSELSDSIDSTLKKIWSLSEAIL